MPPPQGEVPSEARRRGSDHCRDHGLTPLPALRAVLPPEGGAKIATRDSGLATLYIPIFITAPVSAEPTSAAYLAKAPFVYRGSGGCHCW